MGYSIHFQLSFSETIIYICCTWAFERYNNNIDWCRLIDLMIRIILCHHTSAAICMTLLLIFKHARGDCMYFYTKMLNNVADCRWFNFSIWLCNVVGFFFICRKRILPGNSIENLFSWLNAPGGSLLHCNWPSLHIPLLGAGIRGAVRVFSGWNHPGVRKLERLRSLLRLPQCPHATHSARPQPALPVCFSASRPPRDCGHLRLGRRDQGLALSHVKELVNMDNGKTQASSLR